MRVDSDRLRGHLPARCSGYFAVAAVLLCTTAVSLGQQSPTTPPQPATPAPHGQILFERTVSADDAVPVSTPPAAPPLANTSNSSNSSSSQANSAASLVSEPQDVAVELTASERNAPLFTAYDLDLHLNPAKGGLAARARLSVRNDGDQPLTRLAMQISSTLVWTSIAIETRTGAAPLTFVQHRINTDSDHTGVAREVVITLPHPLAPGAEASLTALYAGTIPLSGERLERIGAPAEQALAADWDVIRDSGTWLRGYGNVLWYPTANAPVFLGDGARLFDSVGLTKLREQTAELRLRLTIEYTGEAPDAVYFCGHRKLLTIVNEGNDLPVAESPGIATAEFSTRMLGFRTPSLFVTDRPPTTTDGGLLSAVTDQLGVLNQYAAGAAKVQPLLIDWLGSSPLEPLTILDHTLDDHDPDENSQTFNDNALLVTPMHGGEPLALAPVLVHTLAHAWFRSSHIWLDEGVAQFLSLLWVEQTSDVDGVLARLEADAATLALAEPELKPQRAGNRQAEAASSAVQPATPAVEGRGEEGQSLIGAHSEIYYRTKAAAVLWMLRSIVGDDALRLTLIGYRTIGMKDSDPDSFEHLLEQNSHSDLRWFFEDWVYHDRSLPDLSIVNVATRQIPDSSKTETGWIIAVDVRNDGDAVAEVPVTVRSGSLTATERLRIPGRSNAATRIVFQGTPDEVLVNDGSVPELRTSLHTKKIVVKSE